MSISMTQNVARLALNVLGETLVVLFKYARSQVEVHTDLAIGVVGIPSRAFSKALDHVEKAIDELKK